MFSDKNGKISYNGLRIPSDIKSGEWTINVKSGSNFNTIQINITAEKDEGIIILIEEGKKIPSIGKSMEIKIKGVRQTVNIEINSADGRIIDKLAFVASDNGEVNLPWIIPKNAEPGIYTIKVDDAYNSEQKTFEIK